jgi:type IV secretory pathway VirB10-like protein
MSDTNPSKLDPETLVLKASPRRVVRFKRNLLIGIAAMGCAAICGVTWVALKNSGIHVNTGNANLYNPDNRATPDELSSLPSNYSQIPKSKPQLGPPLPGDLGPPIVEREQQLGLNPSGDSNSEDEAARAERLRLAQQAQQASEAGVFFQMNQNGGGATVTPVSPETSAPGVTAAADSTGADTSRLNLDFHSDQNDQQRKLDVVNQPSAASIYNDDELQTPASSYEILAGTSIAASLITGLNSDLPGEVTAQVTENVYDTVTGQILLIPQGSKLIGSYDSVVAFGQSRALLVWQRIIMPDGSSIQIDNLPATDTAGYAGLSDTVDYHTWTLLKGIALSTLLGVGTATTFGSSQSNLVQAIEQSTEESTNQAGQRVVEKDLNIQPTITVRPGWPLNVIVSKDLILRPYQG